MSKKILVPDSDLIQDIHEQKLKAAGLEVVRTPKGKLDEQTVKGLIGDMDAAIIGSMNVGTKAVFDEAKKLQLVVFPGIGYPMALPDWEYAVEKGIKIANTPDAPTQATAEWSMMAALMMSRGAFTVGRTGSKSSEVLLGLEGQRVGIFALGRIGKRIARMMMPFRPASLSYYSRNRHEEEEKDFGLKFVEELQLFRESDILFITAPDGIGKEYFNAERFSLLSDQSLVVSISRNALFDYKAVAEFLARGGRMAQDDPVPELEARFEPEQWFTNRGHNGANTVSCLSAMNDMATETIINFFQTGEVINDVTLQ